MQWFLKVLRQYADFKGRARRTEFWMFTLVTVIISIVLRIADFVLELLLGYSGIASSGYGILSAIFSLAILVPTLAVGARRLHDIDRSGWWQAAPYGPFLLLLGVPLVVEPTSGLWAVILLVTFVVTIAAFIVLIVWFATDGRPGVNRFGSNPKEVPQGPPQQYAY